MNHMELQGCHPVANGGVSAQNARVLDVALVARRHSTYNSRCCRNAANRLQHTLASPMPATSLKKTVSFSAVYCSLMPFICRCSRRISAMRKASASGSITRLICSQSADIQHDRIQLTPQVYESSLNGMPRNHIRLIPLVSNAVT